MGFWDKISFASHLDILFERITSPFQTRRIVNLIGEIKDIASSGYKSNLDKVCESLDLIVELKREHYEDYDEIFNILRKIVSKYDESPSEMRERLESKCQAELAREFAIILAFYVIFYIFL